MMELLKQLYPLRLAPVSPDTDKAVEILVRELPFKVKEYPTAMEHNGWIVPMKWHVSRALIKKDGKTIYDGLESPLGVIGYSQSYIGTVGLEELKRHLFYKESYPEAVVYHCDLYYKASQRYWGFCIPLVDIEALEPGEYEVELVTHFEEGTLKVLEYHLPGRSEETIILNAHNCHAGQANDDIAGVVAGVEIMRRLAERNNRYSYRLIIAPEHFGTICYLSDAMEEDVARLKAAFFLEMVGSKERLAIQHSFTGNDEIDHICRHYFGHLEEEVFFDDFRKIIGNDETVWESPGFEIPTVSISRYPYKEYHTNFDNEDIVSETQLESSVSHVMSLIDMFEKNRRMRRKFKGLIALSNPKYDLYISTYDPSLRPSVDDAQRKWNYLMDCLPRYFDEKMTVLEIADKHGLYFEDVYAYIKRFEDKGLIEFVD